MTSTLPQVPGPLQIQGDWPARTTIKRGWFKATARPWNTITNDATIRLERGSSSFLADATAWLTERAAGSVYSPALYRSATRAWVKASFVPFVDLAVLEKRLVELPERSGLVSLGSSPDLAGIAALDLAAFDEFWHMGEEGLGEALDATPRSTVLEVRDGKDLFGYAIVGVSMGISYLQRIATHPQRRGTGLGRALLADAFHWARAAGSATMVLNVKPDNVGAIGLYLREGFVETGNLLQVMRYTR